MNQHIRPVQLSAEAFLISSYWKQPGAPLGININTMVLASREPVLFDTGVSGDRDGWLATVASIVEPDDVRWIVLTHDDHDHTGNLETALSTFPNATVVANWFLAERLTGVMSIPPHRMRWVGSGETLDIGDRTLVFERPPLFDSPTTRAVFDPSTGLYWGGDLGAAVTPDAPDYAADAIPAVLADGFQVAHRWNSPWYEMLDDTKYQKAVSRLESFGIQTWANTHGPVYQGELVSDAIALLRTIPAEAPKPQPGQADLDAIIASVLAHA